MTNEAAFLQLRQRRVESRHKELELKREKANRLDAFWAAFKSVCLAWNHRLQEIENAAVIVVEQGLPLESQDYKRRVHLQLTELAEELKEIKSLCLSTSSTTSFIGSNLEDGSPLSAASPLTTDTTNLPQLLIPVPPLPDEFSATDLRLLHRDLTQCQTALGVVRHKVLPQGKFVFTRYRRRRIAWLEQQEKDQKSQPQQEPPKPLNGSIPVNESSPSVSELLQSRRQFNEPHALQDLIDTSVTVLPDGTFELLKPPNDETCRLLLLPPERPSMDRPSMDQLVLRNLSRCTVKLLGSYKSLHLVNVNHSNVVVVNAVQGAVHVTQCHSSTLTLSTTAQQLRLHASTNLTFHGGILAGAILEECRDITFVQNNNDTSDTTATPLDVKDFDWLRNDAPSPNYTIQLSMETQSTLVVAAAAVSPVLAVISPPAHVVVNAVADCTDQTILAGQDESDDDEL